MVQRKKPEVREAILAAAFRLFARRGYAATMVADIAREAGVSPGNVYIYFRSKLEILYAIYDPWLRARIEADRKLEPAELAKLFPETLGKNLHEPPGTNFGKSLAERPKGEWQDLGRGVRYWQSPWEPRS